MAESKSRDADAKAKSVKAQLDSYARTAPRNGVWKEPAVHELLHVCRILAVDTCRYIKSAEMQATLRAKRAETESVFVDFQHH